MNRLGDVVALFVFGIMISIVWIRDGLHWGWVVGVWVGCYFLNLFYQVHKNRVAKVYDLRQFSGKKIKMKKERDAIIDELLKRVEAGREKKK